MKNLKNYLFVAAATLFGIVGCNTLKQKVITTHNITTNNTPGTTTKITTKTDRRTHETIATTSSVSSTTCDSCICLNFNYGPGKPLDTTKVSEYVGNYGNWAGQIRKQLNTLVGETIPPDSNSIHGILGWTIPFGDIKELIEEYNKQPDSVKKVTDKVGFTAYVGFEQTLSPTSKNLVALSIDTGMTKTHLMLVLTVNGKERLDLGFRDLIQPCPNTCDHNTALAETYKKAYQDGYNK